MHGHIEILGFGTEEQDCALARFAARDRSIDAQLPCRGLSEGDAVLLERVGGEPSALGILRSSSHAETDPGALWGALQRDELELFWDGNRAALGELLDRWIARVSGDLAPDNEWETSMSVSVPSRDSDAAIPLLSRGFALIGVSGIRIGTRGADADAAEQRLASAGYRLRQADESDAVLLGRLDAELLAHDAAHGHVSSRPNAGETLSVEILERLRVDPEWTWIIEGGGAPLGYLSIEIDRPRHLAECAAGDSVAHIQAMYLRPGLRGAGIGEAVVDFAHGRLESAGHDRITLGYAALNPRSGPFWCRQGYRPLWNHWQRRPAR